MSTQGSPRRILRFGAFQCDLSAGELRKNGLSVHLAQQPFRLLEILLERPGEVVTRQELRERLWPQQTFGEFDDGLNTAINKLRAALNDRAGNPQFVETIPRRGYRFGAAVQEVPATSPEPKLRTRNSELPHDALEIGNTNGGAEGRFRASFPFSKRIAVAVAGVAVFGLVAWLTMNRPRLPRVLAVHRITRFGMANAVATNGKRLYVEKEEFGRHSIVEVPSEGGTPIPVTTPFRNTRLLDVSPDGSDLLIAEYENPDDPWRVWILPLDGGPLRRLGNVASRSAKWSPDGGKIAFERKDGALCMVTSDGSNVREILADGGIVESWSPDGRRLRFTRLNPATGSTSLWEVRSDGTRLRPVFPERQDAHPRWGEGQNLGRWTPDGKYFLFREASNGREAIWALREKEEFFAPRVFEPLSIYPTAFGIEGAAMSPSGKQLFLVGRIERRQMVRYDRPLRRFVPFLPDKEVGYIRWSPDGQSEVYTTLPNHLLWRANADGTERVQLTLLPMEAFEPAWSPDGHWLAFNVHMPGKPGKICLLPAQDGTPEMLLAEQPTQEDSPSWSPDGHTLMFRRAWLDKEGKPKAFAVTLLDLKTGSLSNLPGGKNVDQVSWSPNGRYVAAITKDFSKLMLFDFHTRRWTQIAAGGTLYLPTWTSDSKSIYFQDRTGGQGQPIYRYALAAAEITEVANQKNLLSPGAGRYLFAGLMPNDTPVAVVIQKDSDVYSLDLDLP